jgi:hypothetical protein
MNFEVAGGANAVKGAYKRERGRDASRGNRLRNAHSDKQRRRVRKRRIVVGAALVLCALLAAAGYLSDEGKRLLGLSSGEQSASVDEPAASAQSEATSGGDQGSAESSPNVLLGEYFTDYAWDQDPGRQSNEATAAGAIDGTILKPGEEFSALKVLSPLSYKPAKVFSKGGIAVDEGGGLCQVSSTLFMAANYADLDILERNQHYAQLPYIRPGLDATVWFGTNGWGALDMRFKNNTDGRIMLREFVNKDGFLIAQIYGDKPSGKTVSMTSKKVEESLSKGIKWDTYKKVTDENGKVTQDGLLYESVYSYSPPVPAGLDHGTTPRGSTWLDPTHTTG